MDKSRLDDGTVLVGFGLPAVVTAASVAVCGDFNDWSPESHPLQRGADGGFSGAFSLPAGRRWRFRYLLDGVRWENDWAADDYESNGQGSDDSIVDLTGAEFTGEPAQAAGPREARRRRWWQLWGRQDDALSPA